MPPDAQTRKLMAEAERDSIKFDQEMLRMSLDWAAKCRVHVERKLQQQK